MRPLLQLLRDDAEILQRVAILLLGACACVGASVVGMMLLEPFEYHYDFSRIENDREQAIFTIRPGETIYPHRRFTANRPFDLTAQRTISRVDDGVIMVLFEQEQFHWGTGVHERRSEVVVPKTLPPGRYVYRLDGVARVNPLREVEFHAPPVEFEVVQ